MTGKELLEFLQTIDEEVLKERIIIQLKSGEWYNIQDAFNAEEHVPESYEQYDPEGITIVTND